MSTRDDLCDIVLLTVNVQINVCVPCLKRHVRRKQLTTYSICIGKLSVNKNKC